MFRRRKRKHQTVNEAQSESPPSIGSPNPDTPSHTTTVNNHQKTKTSPLLSDAFRSAVEKASDRSRSELASVGKLKPMAFFVQADGTMKTVSFSLKGEYQKEALIQRIREKALAENIPTVVVLSEIDNEHGMLLSGVSPDMKGSARVNYSFDNKTKAVTSWKITWLNQPVQNVLLDGIFEKKG